MRIWLGWLLLACASAGQGRLSRALSGRRRQAEAGVYSPGELAASAARAAVEDPALANEVVKAHRRQVRQYTEFTTLHGAEVAVPHNDTRARADFALQRTWEHKTPVLTELLDALWPHLRVAIKNLAIEQAEPYLREYTTFKVAGRQLLQSLHFTEFHLGNTAPAVENIILEEGNELVRIGMDMSFNSSAVIKMTGLALGGIGVERIQFRGRLLVQMALLSENLYSALCGGLLVYFANRPEFDLEFSGLAALSNTESIHGAFVEAVLGSVDQMLVLPNTYWVPTAPDEELMQLADGRNISIARATHLRALGILRIQLIEGAGLSSVSSFGSPRPYAIVRVGAQVWQSEVSAGHNPTWKGGVADMFVYDSTQAIQIELFSDAVLRDPFFGVATVPVVSMIGKAGEHNVTALIDPPRDIAEDEPTEPCRHPECVFPFTFEGVEYSECTFAKSRSPWCSKEPVMTGRQFQWCDCEGKATANGQLLLRYAWLDIWNDPPGLGEAFVMEVAVGRIMPGPAWSRKMAMVSVSHRGKSQAVNMNTPKTKGELWAEQHKDKSGIVVNLLKRNLTSFEIGEIVELPPEMVWEVAFSKHVFDYSWEKASHVLQRLLSGEIVEDLRAALARTRDLAEEDTAAFVHEAREALAGITKLAETRNLTLLEQDVVLGIRTAMDAATLPWEVQKVLTFYDEDWHPGGSHDLTLTLLDGAGKPLTHPVSMKVTQHQTLEVNISGQVSAVDVEVHPWALRARSGGD